MVNLFDTADQVVSATIIWAIGLIITEAIRRQLNIKLKTAYFLYIWHTIFCLAYALYALSHTADANVYYQLALNDQGSFRPGTGLVVLFTSLFVLPFHLSYFGAYLVFNIVGSIGLLLFYKSIRTLVRMKDLTTKKLAFLAVLLPGVSFWSAGLGKDAISFLSVNIALWSALNLKKRLHLMLIAIILMTMVRPHMAGIMTISLSIALFFDKRINILIRWGGAAIVMSIIVLLAPLVMEFVGLENSRQNTIIEYVETRQSYNQTGGGGIDISNMSLPLQLFTYFYRPLPFEVKSLTSLLASLDNIFLLLLSTLFLFKFSRGKAHIDSSINLIFICSFLFISWVVLSMTTANLGISVRQKIMFLPYFIFLIFIYIGKKNHHR